MEEGKTAAQEEVIRAADPKTEQEKKAKEEQESRNFRDYQEKVEDGLESLQINQNEEKGFKANKEAVEVSGKAFELKVKEDLNNYPSWLRTKNSGEIDNSADIIITMTQTESGLNLVREKVRAYKGFKAAVDDLFERASALRDKISVVGNNLEGDNTLGYIDSKDSWTDVDEDYDDDHNVTRRYVRIEKENPTTGETEVEEKDITTKEQDRRYEIFKRELKRRVELEQERINIIAKVLAENAPEAK